MLLFIRDNGKKEAYYDLMNKIEGSSGATYLKNVERTAFASGIGTDPGTKSGVVDSG